MEGCEQVAGSLGSVLPEATQISIHGGKAEVRGCGHQEMEDGSCAHTENNRAVCEKTMEQVLFGMVPVLWYVGEGREGGRKR